MDIISVLLKDGYKVGHPFQYPNDTILVYSNLTPRASRVRANGVISFGQQYFVKDYLMKHFNQNFFSVPQQDVLRYYKRRINNYLGPVKIDHIANLHELGYLPLHVKAIPEGTLVPFRVPVLTLYNTHPEFFWLTNMVETLLSNVLWTPMTSATTAFGYRKVFEQYAKMTGADPAFIKWQGHDFSMRGMQSIDSAAASGAAHLLSFTGTDTIPAIDFLEQYYQADCEKELIGGSVPATEHSVMCMGEQDGEINTIRRLITEVYPSGPISIVADTWDFWKVLTEYLPALKNDIMARDGKVIIRPDSGDPVKIVCGDASCNITHVAAGAIDTLWQTFGGTVTPEGYRVLDSHIGLIYGDSITPERQVHILDGLAAKKFASSNVVLGIGSFTYQYVTRDTYGFAMKATYGETSRGPQAIFKKPLTDDGTKNSAKGLLRVDIVDGRYQLKEDCTWEEESGGALRTIFKDGMVFNQDSLATLRERVEREIQLALVERA